MAGVLRAGQTAISAIGITSDHGHAVAGIKARCVPGKAPWLSCPPESFGNTSSRIAFRRKLPLPGSIKVSSQGRSTRNARGTPHQGLRARIKATLRSAAHKVIVAAPTTTRTAGPLIRIAPPTASQNAAVQRLSTVFFSATAR